MSTISRLIRALPHYEDSFLDRIEAEIAGERARRKVIRDLEETANLREQESPPPLSLQLPGCTPLDDRASKDAASLKNAIAVYHAARLPLYEGLKALQLALGAVGESPQTPAPSHLATGSGALLNSELRKSDEVP